MGAQHEFDQRLRGKRIAFEANGPSAYFVYDLLNTVQLKPSDVVLLPRPTQADAIEVFNKGEADAVSGWEPVIFGAEKGGGKPLATSKDFRSILGGVVFAPESIKQKRAVIQGFHDAWFDALDVWDTDFGKASQSVADWGNNEYLGVKKETAEQDMRILISGVAQASLAENARALGDLPLVTRRMQQARGLWAAAGHTAPTAHRPPLTARQSAPSCAILPQQTRAGDWTATHARWFAAVFSRHSALLQNRA